MAISQMDLFTAPGDTQKLVNKFIKSGISGAQLARNPRTGGFLKVANLIQGELDRGSREVGGTARWGLESFAVDFDLAQQSLRREFIGAETERLFGPQNVTSRTSTVGPGGVRVPVPGQGTTTTPTAEQIKNIESSFRTPFQRILSGERGTGAVARGGSAAQQRRQPTVVSGAGVQRKRPATGAPKPTILTSDADAQIGGQTLLG